jgi:hypothetical protein
MFGLKNAKLAESFQVMADQIVFEVSDRLKLTNAFTSAAK